MRIRDLIKRPTVTVEKCATVREAVKKMVKENVGLLVVVDESGKVYGVLSERDVIRLVAEGVNPDEVKVESVATRPVITVTPDEPVSRAAELMRKYGIRHVVVVDDSGRPVGVLSVRDLVDVETALSNIASVESEIEETQGALKVTS